MCNCQNTHCPECGMSPSIIEAHKKEIKEYADKMRQENAACIITNGTGKDLKLLSVCKDIKVARKSIDENKASFSGEALQIWRFVE